MKIKKFGNYLVIGCIFLAFGKCCSQPDLPHITKEQVNARISGGITFLKRSQLPNGMFGQVVALNKSYPLAAAAFPALALLENGVDSDSPEINKAAAFVRHFAPRVTKTYELSLAILFLNRLGRKEDEGLIRSLALQLIAGQKSVGGWTYDCPKLTKAQEGKLLKALPSAHVPDFSGITRKAAEKDMTDNSNTQFALLGLLAARNTGIPLKYSLGCADQRFLITLRKDGWGYGITGTRATGSMTCAGLLGLGIGQAYSTTTTEYERMGRIRFGIIVLGSKMNDPTDNKLLSGRNEWGPNGTLNYYFLWSVERVGVLYDLQTIGGKDWYQWGARLILANQRPDGSWLGRGSGGNPVVDTSFALLFLRKSDLLPDLRVTLKKRLRITDPWLDGKTLDPKSFPGGLPTPYRPGEEGSLKDRLPPTLRPRPSDPPRLGGKGKQ